ncbi:hypothetical protein [Mycolicibacterium sp. XJ870]
MAAYGASKAGVEQFANVSRIEAAHHGVGAGSAQMSLVDTPELRETQSRSEDSPRLWRPCLGHFSAASHPRDAQSD